MVHVTFYAQPRRNRPFLNLGKLKQGKIEEVTSPEGVNILAFTDLGSATWKTIRQVDPNATLEVVDVKDPRHTWVVKVQSSYFAVNIKAKVYRELEDTSYPALNKIIALECDGDYYSIVLFLQGVHGLYSKKKPDEISDFKAFTTLTAISKQDHQALWQEYTAKDLKSETEERLRYLEGMITKAANRGVNVHDASEMVGKMKAAINHMEFNVAMDLARMIETYIEGATYEHKEMSELSQDANDAVMFIQSMLSDARKDSVDVSPAEHEFSLATQAFAERDFQRVMDYTSRTKAILEDLRYKHKQAGDQLQYVQSLMSEAKKEGKKLDAVNKVYKKAEKSMGTGDYDQVLEFTDEVRRMLDDTLAVDTSSMSAKQQATHLINNLKSSIQSAKKLGMDTTDPEEALDDAIEQLDGKDLEKAKKFAQKGQGLMEAIQTNYTSATELIRDLANEINEYKNYMDVSKAETLIEDAKYAMEDNDYEDALLCARKATDTLEKIKTAARPRLSIGFASNTFQSGVWNRCKLNITNSGKAHAKNVELTFSGSVEVMRLQRIPLLKAGERKIVEMAMRSEELGEIPLDMEISYYRHYDDAKYQAVGVKWVKYTNLPVVDGDTMDELPDKMAPAVDKPKEETKKEEKVEDKDSKDMSVDELVAKLAESYTYLAKSETTNTVFDMFAASVKKGTVGLCITRAFPKRIYEKYDIEGTKLIWLTNVEGDGMIRPSDLEKIRHNIAQFLKEHKGGIVLLDGLEYLITHNKYESVLKFVQSLKDQVAISHSVLLIPISPSTVETHELKLLEREMDEILEF